MAQMIFFHWPWPGQGENPIIDLAILRYQQIYQSHWFIIDHQENITVTLLTLLEQQLLGSLIYSWYEHGTFSLSFLGRFADVERMVSVSRVSLTGLADRSWNACAPPWSKRAPASRRWPRKKRRRNSWGFFIWFHVVKTRINHPWNHHFYIFL